MNNQTKNMNVPMLRFPEFKDIGEWEEKTLDEVLNSESSMLAQNKLELCLTLK